ncbi:MAG: hypothetical protein NUW37_00655 [Planctomycetes bacterium]|nr:hypothetical protein [Planctomycetota bacterium]
MPSLYDDDVFLRYVAHKTLCQITGKSLGRNHLSWMNLYSRLKKNDLSDK